MRHYIDSDSDSNINAYDYGEDFIVVEFKDGSKYEYTYDSAGSYMVEQMKGLADRGDGLNSFISTHKPRYARKY